MSSIPQIHAPYLSLPQRNRVLETKNKLNNTKEWAISSLALFALLVEEKKEPFRLSCAAIWGHWRRGRRGGRGAGFRAKEPEQGALRRRQPFLQPPAVCLQVKLLNSPGRFKTSELLNREGTILPVQSPRKAEQEAWGAQLVELMGCAHRTRQEEPRETGDTNGEEHSRQRMFLVFTILFWKGKGENYLPFHAFKDSHSVNSCPVGFGEELPAKSEQKPSSQRGAWWLMGRHNTASRTGLSHPSPRTPTPSPQRACRQGHCCAVQCPFAGTISKWKLNPSFKS